MSINAPPRVFLSYARKDGEAFATALRRRLAAEEPEISLWQDRAEMEGGVGWWAQIETALDQVKFLVIVMTPQAMVSEMTKREWRYARKCGVLVYPVKGVPDDQLDYDALPRWMKKAHFFDIGQWTGHEWRDVKEWETFVNYLKSDRQPHRVPFLAPDLPRGFVPRPREYEALLASLLGPDQKHPTSTTTGLHGSGGYGKTTLAIALCHDDRVADAFDDGVLWTSLGQTPRLLDEFAKWYEAITGQRPAFVDIPQAMTQLAKQLESRHCLLVIDDVWKRSDLEPFLHGAPDCARVVTSRRLDLLSDARRVRVDEMSPAEARQLFNIVVPEGVVAQRRLLAVTRRLGEWPLLLKLASAMIQSRLVRGDSADGALTFVERALDKHGVVAFDVRNSKLSYEAVSRTIAASREQLEPEDNKRFGDLGIFPEEALIPLLTLGRLWQLDEVDTEECAHRLDDVALLSLDLQRGVVSLHDVMRAYLQQEQRDVAEIHARLVAAYGDAFHLPDAYAWRWLPYHMARARQPEQLRALLLRPDWLQTQLNTVGAYAMLSSFDAARGDRLLERLQQVLRLALPTLVADASQFCEQLLGRLSPTESEELGLFRRRLEEVAPAPRLHARWPNLVGSSSLVQTLPTPTIPSAALALPDGGVLSWSHDDATLRVWDLTTGECRALACDDFSGTRGALVLPDDGRVLSWSRNALRVWDLTTGENRELTTRDSLGPRAMVILGTGIVSVRPGALVLPDGRVLSWSGDATLRVWDLTTGEVSVLTGHKDGVFGALVLLDKRVLSWGDDATLRVWDLTSGESLALVGHDRSVRGAKVLSDGHVLSWSDDSTLRVWDLTSGESRALTGHDGSHWAPLELADGGVLYWGDEATLECGTSRRARAAR